MRKLALVIAAALLTVLPGCRNRSSNEVVEDKLQYSGRVNEVEVMTLKSQNFPMQLVSNGKLSATRRSALIFRQSGVIKEITAANGSYVEKGAVIARLDDVEQQSALESAQTNLDRATLDLKDVLVGLGYSTAEGTEVPEDIMKMATIRSGYSSAKNSYDTAVRNLEGTVLKAPFSGKVADIKQKVWETSGSEPFCTIINDNEFDVVFTVLESEYSFVSKGQPVRVSLFGEEDKAVNGRIVSINPTIDKNGQISVTARIPGNGRMLDGMNVKIIVEKTLERQLVVPKSAVVVRDGLDVLFRYVDGRAEWVYVEKIKANSESYAIRGNADRNSEVNEGDQIIISGNFNLADKSRVTIKK